MPELLFSFCQPMKASAASKNAGKLLNFAGAEISVM